MHTPHVMAKPVPLRIVFLLVAGSFLPGHSRVHAEGTGSPDEPFVVAYSHELFPGVDQHDAQAATTVWVQRLIERTGLPLRSEAFVFNDLPQLVRSMYSDHVDNVDVMILLGVEYLQIRDEASLLPMLMGSREGSVYYQYLLLVHRDSNIGSVDRLRDKKLIVERGYMGDVSLMWLDTFLWGNDLPGNDAFFGEVRAVSRASQAIFPVFFKQADACLVPTGVLETMAELNPQLGEELVILQKSSELCRGVICLHEDTYEKYGEVVLESLRTLHENASGQHLLSLFDVDKLVPFDTGYLDSMAELVEVYEGLKGAVK